MEIGRSLGAAENVFTYEGEPGHEIALIYECRLGDRGLYAREAWEVSEPHGDGSRVHKLAWTPIASFADGDEILYPDGAADLVRRAP